MNHGNKATFWAGVLWAGISDTDKKTIMAALSKMLENPLVKKLLQIPQSFWPSAFGVIAVELEKAPGSAMRKLRYAGMHFLAWPLRKGDSCKFIFPLIIFQSNLAEEQKS